jgi:radical SAM protein with 4Fe4S-binding SPASM domain
MKQVERLYRGDGRVGVLLGKQKTPKEGIKIRKSQFVFSVNMEGHCLLFHTLTRELLAIEPKYYDYFADDRLFPASILEDEIIKDFYANHFLVPEDVQESRIYIGVKNILVVKEELPEGIARYTILPTTVCNARCFYCFEQGIQYRKMSRNTVDDVLRFIVEHKTEKQKQIRITWFGGEPMCAADNIDRLCNGLSEAGIEFTAEMTSNGSLFDQESVKKAYEKWKVNEIQITLDGLADEYARRKQYIGDIGKPFERVIRNIHFLIAAGIKVTIRLNADNNNLEEIYKVLDFLKDEFTDEERKKMRVYAHSLFGSEGEGLVACPAGASADGLEAKVQEINNSIVEKGLTVKDLKQLFTLKTHHCMATVPDRNVLIDATGKLYACDTMAENMCYGNIKTGINSKAWERIIKPYTVQSECERCVFLPQCTEFAGCPHRAAYNNCYKQEKRKLESDIRFAWHMFGNREAVSLVSD